jgi:hypothetical protein
MRRVALLSLLLLTGCGQTDSGLAHLNEYLNRLSTVTETALESQAPPRFDLAPPSPEKGGPTNNQQIDLIDFLSLTGCSLQVNLGRRNTQLGRTAAPSQRLLLDLEFLDLAPACIDLLESRGDTALAATIRVASDDRKRSLPSAVFDAVLLGAEWRAFWHANPTLGDYPRQTSSVVEHTVTSLTAMTASWLNGDWSADNRAFELLLSDVRTGDGGELLLATSQLVWALERANALLTKTQSERPLCPFGQPTERSRALKRVVQQFFVAKVQSWVVSLRRRAELIHEPTQRLETVLAGSVTQPYQDWVVARDTLLAQLTYMTRQHVQAVQATLASCEQE